MKTASAREEPSASGEAVPYPEGLKIVPAAKAVAALRRRIRLYERRYEISTATMFEEVQQGKMRETAEILRWMFDYHGLASLRPETRITGIPLRTTVTSTNGDSPSTRL